MTEFVRLATAEWKLYRAQRFIAIGWGSSSANDAVRSQRCAMSGSTFVALALAAILRRLKESQGHSFVP